jgi:hypothetical protein
MSRLQEALSRPIRQSALGRAELAASLKGLEELIQNLAVYLTRQELEGMVKQLNGLDAPMETPGAEGSLKREEPTC